MDGMNKLGKNNLKFGINIDIDKDGEKYICIYVGFKTLVIGKILKYIDGLDD